MGNLIMPKHSGQVSEFQAALKVCYDHRNINDGWIATGHAAQGIEGFTYFLFKEYQNNTVAGHSTPKKDNSDYTKDAQLPLYFGFMEISDSKSNAMRRITETGIKMYEALVANDKPSIYSLFVESLESMTFGRNNNGCENSDSDLESPNILIVSSIALCGIKRKEFYYILSYLSETGRELSNALDAIQLLRSKSKDTPNVDNAYTDAKIIPLWLSLGFLSEDADKKLHVSQDVMSVFAERLACLRTKNTEQLKKPIVKFLSNPAETVQTIYYGCPGTGKSYEVKKKTEGEHGEKTIWYSNEKNEKGKYPRVENPSDDEKKGLSNNIFRTTFHPDYDYATFVGSYKPIKNDKDILDYQFVPQVFTNAYVTALRHPDDPIYLIIEEINRGNCAQIFGDLFQLLDRDEQGESVYPIEPDTELAKYLKSLQDVPYEELKLPHNLHIYATMNTSDQSLFPMDSAFKRRWAMEYMPINYEHPKASRFEITIAGNKYLWVEFLKMVNEMILDATSSEDKQMGEFFIKSDISEKEFTNKVMFYLWNDVCKDLYNPHHVSSTYFMRIEKPKQDEKEYFTFAELFGPRNDGSRLLVGFINYLRKKYQDKHPDTVIPDARAESAEPAASASTYSVEND